jgi:hypothetical protein
MNKNRSASQKEIANFPACLSTASLIESGTASLGGGDPVVTGPRKDAGSGNPSHTFLFARCFKSLRRVRSGKIVKRSNDEKRDLSIAGFVLILVLVYEIAAVQSDNPDFWLLVGPTPLAIAFTANRLLRCRSSRSGS